MKPVVLKNTSLKGIPLQAVFLPEGGMNLCSYTLGGIEVIDQNTKPLFEERRAGLGALIGPHFHEQSFPPLDFDPNLFPHVTSMLAQGRKDPFSHGIARYVPWKMVASTTQIKGYLHGSDLYQGIPLKVFEGQDFDMTYEARLHPDGLFIQVKIESEKPSVLGLHTYYTLKGPGTIHSTVQETYRDHFEWKKLPPDWTQEGHLYFSLPQKADFGFLPQKRSPNEHDYHLQYHAPQFSLHIDFNTASDSEVSCQVFHPDQASYVCIEPLTARTPSAPRLTRSTLEVKLQIFSH